MKIPPIPLLPLFTVVLLPAFMLCSAAAPVLKNRTAASDRPGNIVFIYPSTFLGGPSGIITIDGKAKKKKAGNRTLSITLEQGVYDFYGVNAFRPRATLTIDGSRSLYLVDQDDTASLGALQGLKSSPDERAVPKRKMKSSGRKPRNVSGMASIVLVAPPSFFGGPVTRISVGGKQRKQKIGEDLLGADVRPCRYAVYGSASADPVATMGIDSAEIVYVVNRNSGRGQRQLGDLFFENGNRKGALALYRGALNTDSTMTDLYLMYAELAIAAGERAEAIGALLRLVGAGLADGRTCQELGDLLAAAGRNDEAGQIYEKALTLAGEDPVVLTALARVKVRTGDLQGAVTTYGQAIRLRPDSALLYKTVGDLLLRQKDTVKAVSSYKIFFEKGGRNPATALFAGRYEYECTHSEDAVRCLVMVTGKEAQKVHYLRMLGESHFRMGDFSKACVPLRVAANKYPRSSELPPVVEMLVDANMSLKDFKKAGYWIDVYAKAGKRKSAAVAFYRAFLKERTSPAAARLLYEQNIVKFPEDYRNFLRYGVLLAADRSSLVRSLVMIQRAVSLADTVPDAWLEISRVYRKLERYDEELQSLQVFITTHPQHPEANARIGELMLKKGETGAALEKLQAADQASADDPSVLKALAQGYAQTGNPTGAIEALCRAKIAAPNDTFVRLRLVDLYRQTGQNEKVLEEYKGIVDMRRDNPTLFGYAKLLQENKKYDEAVSAIEDIRSTQPDNVEALMLLGTILRAQQKFAEAVKVYEEILFLDPADTHALFERAETHLENSQPQWAEAFYKRTLARDPKYALGELGLAKVAKLRRNHDAYKQHLIRAYTLAPEDPVIQQEREAGLQNTW